MRTRALVFLGFLESSVMSTSTNAVPSRAKIWVHVLTRQHRQVLVLTCTLAHVLVVSLVQTVKLMSMSASVPRAAMEARVLRQMISPRVAFNQRAHRLEHFTNVSACLGLVAIIVQQTLMNVFLAHVNMEEIVWNQLVGTRARASLGMQVRHARMI
jgi:hypothetical protein